MRYKIKILFVSLFMASTLVHASKIPKDSIEFEGKHYKVFEAKLSWLESAKKCKEMGGILASVKSNEANDFIIKITGGKCVWLGASDEAKEGEWRWQDGTKVSFTHWAGHEPDNRHGGTEHYLVINWPSYTKGEWGDSPPKYRSQIYGYVCEWTGYPIAPKSSAIKQD